MADEVDDGYCHCAFCRRDGIHHPMCDVHDESDPHCNCFKDGPCVHLVVTAVAEEAICGAPVKERSRPHVALAEKTAIRESDLCPFCLHKAGFTRVVSGN